MHSRLSLLVVMTLLISFASAVQAEEEGEEGTVFGTVYIKVNPKYLKVQVNGKSWDESFFYDEGSTLVIEKLNVAEEWEIKLFLDDYEPVTLKITAKDWKKKFERQGRERVYVMEYRNSVTLKKSVKPPVEPKK